MHPALGTFATGGCDGHVCVWDSENKRRISLLRQYDTSISSMAWSADGQSLAVAASYTFEEGEKEHPPDAVHVVRPLESQMTQRVIAKG